MIESLLTAAIPMDNPKCSCELMGAGGGGDCGHLAALRGDQGHAVGVQSMLFAGRSFSIMRERSQVAVGETAVILHPRLRPH